MKLGHSVAGAALAAAVLASVPAAQAQTTTLRVYGAFIAEHSSSKAMGIFKTEAERLSGRTLEFEITPNTPNGGAREILDEVRSQELFGTWIGAPGLSRLAPEIGALALPFVFENFDQVERILKSPVGALIEEKLEAKGFTVISWMEWGARNVMNARKPLRTLDDFEGLKIRVQPIEAHMAIFRALGARPVALDIKDLYLALRQGDIDGLENPNSSAYDYKFYEYQKYLSDSAHVLDLIPFVVNRKTFMSLRAKEQKAIRDAAEIARVQQWKMAAAEEAGALVKLKEKGMQFDPLPSETRTALRQATAVVVDDARKRLGGTLVDSILASAGAGTIH